MLLIRKRMGRVIKELCKEKDTLILNTKRKSKNKINKINEY
jgi:hypothetical protein